MPKVAVVHTNPGLKHQRQWGDALVRGFMAHGVQAWQTADKDARADIHVVQGPHYAKQRWLDHPRTILLDRSYYSDGGIPGTGGVSLGWLHGSGGRRFKFGHDTGKHPPQAKPWKEYKPNSLCAALVLGDYGQDCARLIKSAQGAFSRVYYRHHPTETRDAPCLVLRGEFEDSLALADVVIGTRSTALVGAVLHGVPAICLDETNIAWPVCGHSLHTEPFRGDRSEWLKDLSWTDWMIDEVASGAAWEYLRGIE